MFTSNEIVDALHELGVTHVVWVPDSTLGKWEPAMEASEHISLLRVCREGEAWTLAAGLYVGGALPIVMMQSTGFFESSDSMRNVIHDLRLPLWAIIGIRNRLIPKSTDSAKRFAQDVIDAWNLNTVWIDQEDDKPKLAQHFHDCRQSDQAGFVLMAEGKG